MTWWQWLVWVLCTLVVAWAGLSAWGNARWAGAASRLTHQLAAAGTPAPGPSSHEPMSLRSTTDSAYRGRPGSPARLLVARSSRREMANARYDAPLRLE